MIVQRVLVLDNSKYIKFMIDNTMYLIINLVDLLINLKTMRIITKLKESYAFKSRTNMCGVIKVFKCQRIIVYKILQYTFGRKKNSFYIPSTV